MRVSRMISAMLITFTCFCRLLPQRRELLINHGSDFTGTRWSCLYAVRVMLFAISRYVACGISASEEAR